MGRNLRQRDQREWGTRQGTIKEGGVFAKVTEGFGKNEMKLKKKNSEFFKLKNYL